MTVMSGLLTTILVAFTVVTSAVPTYTAATPEFTSINDFELEPFERIDHPKLRSLVPRHVDTSDLQHLDPTSNHQLWFAGDVLGAEENRMHAAMHLQWLYPTVVLDHSLHTNESCSRNTMTISFSSAESFSYAQSIWQNAAPLTLVTTNRDCGQYIVSKSEHALFLSKKLVFNHRSSSVLVTGAFVDIAEVASDGSIDCKSCVSVVSSQIY